MRDHPDMVDDADSTTSDGSRREMLPTLGHVMTINAGAPVCRTCAVQYAPGSAPEVCIICDDERQWVPVDGQQWTTLGELADEEHRVEVREIEPGLTGLGVTPTLGIGQRACLVQTSAGNVLWDCIGFIDDAAVDAVRSRGGIAVIAASHPHFYGAMVEWSRAFDAPLLLPAADRAWVVRDDTEVRWWDDEIDPVPGVHLVQCGGHFDGSAVLVWDAGADGRGVALVGDTTTVVADRNVSFMRSYPNLIPLPAQTVVDVAARVTRYPFDRIYGGWWDRVIATGGRKAVTRSRDRYLRWLQTDAPVHDG